MNIRKRILSFVFGEEDYQFNFGIAFPKKESFIDTGHGSGYSIHHDGSIITIKRVSRLALLAGLPALYYFKGEKQAGSGILVGRIMMFPFPKIIFLVWFSVVLITFLLSFSLAMIKAIEFMFMPSQHLEKYLQPAGFLAGATITITLFGILILAVIRFVSRKDKSALQRFCEQSGTGHD